MNERPEILDYDDSIEFENAWYEWAEQAEKEIKELKDANDIMQDKCIRIEIYDDLNKKIDRLEAELESEIDLKNVALERVEELEAEVQDLRWDAMGDDL